MCLQLVVALVLTSGIPERDPDGKPHLRSESVVVRLVESGEIVLEKNPDVVRPIASITKLLSGLLLAAEDVERQRVVTIGEEDKDRLKWSRSHLAVNLAMPWLDLLRAGIGASDNRAIYAAVRVVQPRQEFVSRMNTKARELGMTRSAFVDPAGVDPGNVSTARELLSLLSAAAQNDELRSWSLAPSIELTTQKGPLTLRNPDRLVHLSSWKVVIGKTGYTIEAGRSLAVRIELEGHLLDMVFLGSREMQSVFGDAGRVKRWLLPRLQGKS